MLCFYKVCSPIFPFTLAAIAGPIAEALHGIPQGIAEQAEDRYLADASDIREVIREMYRVTG